MPLSDILACKESEFEDIMSSENPWEQGSWFKAKNIGMIELAQLGEMLHVGTFHELTDGFELIGEPAEDGPWPQTTPPCLMAKLVILSDEEISEVATPWSKIDEFFGVGRPDELASYLMTLREFLESNDGPYFLINGL